MHGGCVDKCGTTVRHVRRGRVQRKKEDLMEKVKKAALSVLAAVALVCLLAGLLLTFPMRSVSAAEVTASDAEALQQAIDGAAVGDKVKLTANITADVTIAEGKEITLDLNGYTLTNASDHTIMNYGKLTIVDGSEAGTGTVDNVTHARGALFNFGEATLLGGTFTRSLENDSSATESGGNSWYVIKNLGYLTIGAEGEQCDVSVTQDGHFSSMITNGYYNADDTGDHLQYNGSVTTEDKEPTLTIYDGSFAGGINTVKNDNHSVSTIIGGKFTNVSQAVVLNWNNLTITGGEFIAGEGAQAAIITSYDDTGFNNGTTNITGGNFDGAIMADYNAANVDYSISGGSFSVEVPAEYIAEGTALVSDGENGYVVGNPEVIAEEQKKDLYVAGGVAYESLAAAVDAVPAVPADNNQVTITLIDGNGDGKLNGDGVVVQVNQNIVIDFNGNTYDVDGKTVGSSGTETNGFQLLKGATVEMKNGTVTATASTAKLLIQKYCDLTLCDMVVDGTKLVGPAANYVISNNNGTTTFTGSTKVLAGEGDYAFDVYYWPANGYDEVKVVFADDFTGTIDGNIQYATDGTNNGSWYTKAILEINGNGTFNGKLDIDEETGYDALEANITISGGTFSEEIPADYLAEDALYYKDENGKFVCMDNEAAEEEGFVVTLNGYGYTSLDAAVEAGAVAYIDKAEGIDAGYTDLQEALEAAEEGETVKLLADVTTTATLQITKKITLDMNGYDITGGSKADNLVIKIAAGGAKIANSSADESVVTLGAREVVGIGVAADLTEEVTIDNIMVEATDKTTTDSVLNGLELSSPTTVKGVTINVSGKTTSTDPEKSYLMMAILAQKDVTIIDSNITATQTEGSTNQLQAVRVQAGSNLTMEGTTIVANGPYAYGVCFFGPYSTAEFNKLLESDPLDTSKFTTLSITDSSIAAYAFAVTGNGATHGTIFDIENSKLVSEAGAAIYHPQYGDMTVSGSTIKGVSGIEVRAGNVTIESSTITATGDPFDADPNGNGSTTIGAALSLVQHTTKLPTQITVKSGTFNGVRAFYQANLQNNDATALKKISADLQGGTYEGEVVSENMTGIVSGGKYSTELDASLFAEGFSGQYLNGYYYALEESGSEGSGSLSTAKLNAQTDVRLYATSALGMSWNKLKTVDGAKDILKLYAAIENATGVGALTIAKTEAMNAVDAYLENVENARAAAVTAVQAAADAAGVTLPTAAYAAINGALTTEEVEMYQEYAEAEIAEIKDLRADISSQMDELQKVSSAVNKLSTAFTGTNNEFDALLKDIEDAIDAAQKEIVDGTSESLTKMQAALETKISAGDKAIESAISTLRTELSNYAAKVDTVKTELQASLTASTGALQTGVDALDEAIGAVQADIDALEAALDAEGGNVEDLAADIAGVKTAVDGISASVESVVEDAQAALSQQIEDADDSSAFTVVYTLVGIALALAAAAVVLQVVTLFKRK